MPCVLVVLCACYGEMCDWLNVWDICCWWGYVLFELRNELGCLNCLRAWKQIVKNECDGIELRWWSNDVMMQCESMIIGGRSIVLFIFAYQILMNIEIESNPKRRGLPHVKKTCGGDSRNWKEKVYGRGLPQLRKYMGEDSRNWERIWAGIPAKKKKCGGHSRNWKRKEWVGLQQKKEHIWWGIPQLNDDMVGTLTRKGLGLQQMYGVVNLISKHERGENWHYTV